MSSNRYNRKNTSAPTGNISFLPQIIDRTNEQFVEEIVKIHENQYTPINHIPTIFGHKLNLLDFYNAVAKRGGIKKMNTESSWEGVLADLKIPIKCANASVALRSLFQRYLEPFERIQRNKATITEIEEELQMESENRYKTSAQRITLSHCNFNPISMVYRTDIHLIDSHKRQESGLSCDLVETVEFQKLELSLRSGLLNEIEFSLNTILLMSFQIDGVQLCRNHRLLDLILSSVGVGDLEMLNDRDQNNRSIRKFIQFWNATITEEEARRFLYPDIFVTSDFAVPELNRLHHMLTLCDELTIYDREGQRIQTVATIIRNLALDSSNGRYITRSHQCMRFIILCYYSSHFALRQLGLEILSMLTFPVVGILKEIVKDILVNLIGSEDRVDRLRGLEILARISDQKVCLENADFLIGLPKALFASLISLLILHDLHMVVLALEAVYGLSEIDPFLCLSLVECSTETLSTLYILLSLEAQVMGTQSLIRIRVMQGPATSTSQMSANRISYQQTQSSNTLLATSLMPPPPVPIYKNNPMTSVSVPQYSSSKPHIYTTTEAPAILNKPQISQRPFQVTTTIEPVFPSTQNIAASYNSVQATLKPELKTTSSIPLITSEKISPNVVNIPSLSATQENWKFNSPPNHTLATTSAIVTSSIANQNTCNNQLNLSSVPVHRPSNDSTEIFNKSAVTASREKLTSVNLDAGISQNSQSTQPIFTNKQDFVKDWLLNNYQESPQCTVLLFVMYKKLQVAVQDYFKDSEMVTAEEFHKLVRILFPQVQLVQLQTSVDNVEIHYYNLKLSPKVSTIEVPYENDISKCKQTVTDRSENLNGATNVPLGNCAQINGMISRTTDNIHTEQKPLKRHPQEMVNGCFSNENNVDQSPIKRPRIPNDMYVTSPNFELNSHDKHINSNPTCKYNNGHPINGMTLPSHNNFDDKNDPLTQFSERQSHVYFNVQPNQILNGSIVEELKHSDSETKAFSSSTVSPVHCDSLANGTDGSSEGTMDSELGRIIVTLTNTDAKMISQTSSVNFNNSSTVFRETPINTAVTSSTNSSENTANKRIIKKNSFNQLGRTRSRFRNNNPSSKAKQKNTTSQKPYNLAYLYICEWDNCLQSFDRPQKVYGHVYTNHFMTLRTEVESICFWAGCNDNTQRTPLPLLNHVNDQHCNNIALESARQIRLAKEKEQSIINTINNQAIKTEPESIPKLLNFCPTDSSNRPISDTSSSYQSNATLSSTSSSGTAATLSSNYLPVSTIKSCDAVTNASLQSESKSSNEHQPKPSAPIAETLPCIVTASCVAPNIMSTMLTPSTAPNIDVSVSESRSCSPSQSICTVSNTQSTTIYSVAQSHNSAITSPTTHTIKQTKTEGPVTKHIRFLSALILRNLCQCSADARRFVAAHSQQIFEMSISGCESSRALGECLFYSTNAGNTRQQKL